MSDNVSYRQCMGWNIGLISEVEQDCLRRAVVTVLGAGGIGGVVAEILARSGVGKLRLVDHDVFEASNLNGQPFAFTDTLGRSKTEVAREFLLRINPDLAVECYETVTEENAAQVVGGSDVVVLGIDGVGPCIAAAREARSAGIPVVEGWAIPYGNVRVIDARTPDLEALYDLPT